MVVLCSQGENCEFIHWREPVKNVIMDGHLENLGKPGHEVANIKDFGSIICWFLCCPPRVKRIIINQPFNSSFTAFLLYYFFYPKYVLLRFLKLLFRKRTFNFLSVIISYFIFHWHVQLNFWNFANLFRLSLNVSFIKWFCFLCYSNMITNRTFWCQGLTTQFWI